MKIFLILIMAMSFACSSTEPIAVAALAQTQQQNLSIKGNRNTKIYHLPGCASYSRISAQNVVWFKTHEQAKAAGYRRARNC